MIGRDLLAGLLLAAVLPFGGTAHRKTEEGNRAYLDGLYSDALRSYTEAQVAAPEAAELYYDIGNVLYREDDFVGAAEAFTRALLSASDDLEGPAAFNLGNAQFRQEEYEQAVDSFERALRVDADDLDAKRNLELSLRALERQEQQQQQQQQQQQDDEQESDEEQEEQREQPSPSEEQPESPESQESASDESAAQEAQGDEAQEQPGRMTPEQAERLLAGLEEQERENLRQQALKQPPSRARSVEKDW